MVTTTRAATMGFAAVAADGRLPEHAANGTFRMTVADRRVFWRAPLRLAGSRRVTRPRIPVPWSGNATLRKEAVIGHDTRQLCGRAFPFSAIGRLTYSINGFHTHCTGALIRSNLVLTASHCVWSTSSRKFVSGDLFVPGQNVVRNASVMPFGSSRWEHITITQAFYDSHGWLGDVAVIKLSEHIDAASGTLGVADACVGKELAMHVAGYPEDQTRGSCWQSSCDVDKTCGGDVQHHECDTSFGMSGAPMFDDEFAIHGVHVRRAGTGEYNEYTQLDTSVLEQLL